MDKYTKSFFLLAAAFSLLLTGFNFFGKSAEKQPFNPSATVMSACTACHDTKRICNALGRKGSQDWELTVNRMVEKGASVKKKNIPVLVDYLAGLKPGSSPVCR